MATPPADSSPTSSMPSDAQRPLDAGTFSAWLRGHERAVAGEQDADVACGTCTACCTSSQFVHIAPDEVDALAAIPAELLFPAPRLPKGHVVLGYDAAGRCPMLGDGGCIIYDVRPRTCRTYDCRIFPATDVVPVDKPAIALQARRWRFSHPSGRDRAEHEAVRAAAAQLATSALGAPGAGPSPTQLALSALDLHHEHLEADG